MSVTCCRETSFCIYKCMKYYVRRYTRRRTGIWLPSLEAIFVMDSHVPNFGAFSSLQIDLRTEYRMTFAITTTITFPNIATKKWCGKIHEIKKYWQKTPIHY